MPHRRRRLEDLVLTAFEQALAEGRVDAAEHLLCALEAGDARDAPRAPLARAYRSIAHSAAVDDLPSRPAAGRAAM
jgi:hypothetical protein